MSFDVHDIESYFLEGVDRTEAEKLLVDKEVGTFLVRKSSNKEDLALSLKEPAKIGHYQISRKVSNTRSEFKIGNQSFPALPELLTFYKLYYVGDASLVRPINSKESVCPEEEGSEDTSSSIVPRLALVISTRVPNAYDENQLHLEKGEYIEVLRTNDNGTWEGRRLSTGTTGFFPFNHVRFVDSEEQK